MALAGNFRNAHPLATRTAEFQRIRNKYPDGIPVIVERAWLSNVSDIDRSKYVVPADLTAGQFVNVVRKRLKPAPERATVIVFVEINQLAATMADIYADNRDVQDGFLYLTYRGAGAGAGA